MENDPGIFLKKILAEIPGNPHNCEHLLNSFNRCLLEEQIDSSLMDVYLVQVFHSSTGLIKFIEKTEKIKSFKNATGKAVEILYTLLNNFGELLSETNFIDIYKICIQVTRSNCDYHVKMKVFDLILLSFDKISKYLENQEIAAALKQVLASVLNGSKQKHSDTVKEKELLILGNLSRKFGFLVDDDNSIKGTFMRNLQMAKACKVISQNFMNGFFNGLSVFCESYPLKFQSDDKGCVDEIYKIIKVLAVVQEKRKMGSRAALKFLSRHVSYFEVHIMKEYKFWHETLISWLNYTSPDDKLTGFLTLNSCFEIMFLALEKKDSNEDKALFEFFYQWSKEILENEQQYEHISRYEKRLVVSCINKYATVAHKYLNSKDFLNIFVIFMQVFENSYILTPKIDNDDIEYMPDFIKTIANFMRLKSITSSEYFCLQKGVIVMIKSFHNLSKLHHNLVIDALITTLFYLRETQYFDVFVENIVYIGVAWACSHEHSTNASQEPYEKIITVKNYFPLWIGLLKISHNKSYEKLASYSERRQMVAILAKELIKSLLKLITKLNISVQPKEDLVAITEIECAYQVKQPNDYAIFLNVVDFYEKVFELIEPSLFRNCICRIMKILINKCVQYPLTSGFYKLLSFSLRISRSLNIFNDADLKNDDICNCRQSLSSFITILINKMSQFKDELLMACLYVLLELPAELVKDMLDICVDPLKKIFTYGRSYLPLAEIALNTLENWQEIIDPEGFEPFLEQLVPCLDTYLRSKSVLGHAQSTMEKRRKTTQTLQKRKVILEIEPELIRLQKRILSFIGRQSIRICKSFIFSDNINSICTITGQNKHLKIGLPFDNENIDVYMDVFLPRIIDLSLHCSDRKTRVLACEVLHGLIMLFLGRAKAMSESSLSNLNNILRIFSMPLMELACDIDQVVRQIFEPLFLQMMHWYSSRTQIGGTHSGIIIIEVVLEGITHPTNSALRDFSGKCVREFVKWSIKQSTQKNLSSNLPTIKSFVRHMRFYSSHPDPSKKLGAALIFNSIYREIREEDELIDIFWIEILHIFVTSLSTLAYQSEDSLEIYQINNALQHLKRVFLEKPHIFRKSNSERRIPNDLGNGTIDCIAIWLLKQISSNNRYCRASCIELFLSIAPLCSDKKMTLKSFIEKHLDKNILSFYPSPDLKCIQEESSILFMWIEYLLQILDVFNFLIRYNPMLIQKDDQILKHVNFFLDKYRMIDTAGYSSIGKEQFMSLKSLIVLSILKAYNGLLHDVTLEKITLDMSSKKLWGMLETILFAPHLLGITEFNEISYHELITILCNTIPDKISAEKLSTFMNSLDSYIKENLCTAIDPKKNANRKQRDLLNGVLFISRTKLNEHFKVERYATGLMSNFMESFLKTNKDGIIFVDDLLDTVYVYCERILEFSLKNSDELLVFFDYLYANYEVSCMSMAMKTSFGFYILRTFDQSVTPYVFDNFGKFINFSIEKGNWKTMVEILNQLLDIMLKHHSYKEYHETVWKEVSNTWIILKDFFNGSYENKLVGMEYLKLSLQICQQSSIDIHNWLVQLLMEDNGNNIVEIFTLLVYATDEALTETSDTLEVGLTYLMREKKIDETIFNKVLFLFPHVKSSRILIFLLEIYNQSNSIVDVAPYVNKCMKNSDKKLQEKHIDCIFKVCCNQNLEWDYRYKFATKVLSPTLQSIELQVFETFFTKNLNLLLEQLQGNNYEMNIINFMIVEIILYRIPDILEKSSISKNQPKLLQLFMKIGLDTFKIENSSNVVRLLKCHAYNALASIISNSSKLNKNGAFYEKMFVRQSNGRDILWSGIIDMDYKFHFPITFDKIPEQRKVLVNIRDELREKRSNKLNQQESLRYMESQRLFNSSLNEDITKYDFSNVMVRTKEPNEFSNHSYRSELLLDATDINDHESMVTVCGLIQHIFDSGVHTLPDEDDSEVSLPLWMKGIRELLIDRETHNNIKIFLVKVIDNMIQYFTPFSRYFLEPLLQFIVDKCCGDTINYFTMDVLIILSRWASEIKSLNEEENQLASKMLDTVIRMIKVDRIDIFKFNLDIIKLIVESWKSLIDVPKSLIIDMIQRDDTTEIGIQIASIFLVNHLELWYSEKERIFFDLLMSKFKSSNKSIFKPCSEILGLFVKHLDGKYVEQINQCLKTFKFDKYLVCLEGIVIHYPRIVDSFHACKLISTINQFPDRQKIEHLKIVYRRISTSLDLIDEMRDFSIVEWDKLLENGNLEIEIISLEIVKKCLIKFVTYDSFPNIIKTIKDNVVNTSSLYRSSVYDIAISLYKLENSYSEDANEILIFGLADNDLDNRDKVMKFWTNEANLPGILVERFPFILSKMYKSKIEDTFLGYLTYFLIDLLKESRKFSDDLFESPLEDCSFEEYKLRTNWRLQHPSTVPMFAETMQTVNNEQLLDETNFYGLRGTQTEFDFNPTQSIHEQQLSKLTSLESSLDWNSGTLENNFKNPNKISLSQKYKKRFLSDKSKISRSFARYETEKKVEKMQRRFDLAKEKEKKVTVIRKYRKGDFPDVQIPLSSIIEPLQILALNDHEISKQLFVEIFKGIATKIANDKIFLMDTKNSIVNIFNTSTNFSTYLIGALLDIVLEYKKYIKLDSNLITWVCQQSGLTSVGTLLLEEYINSLGDNDDENYPSSKKGFASNESCEVRYWVKLAELYKDLEEWDVVRAIFLEKMNCKDTIQNALRFESEGVWRLAQKSYQELITTDISNERKDFYYDSYFSCFANLGEWEKLPSSIASMVDSSNSWDSLWSDTWNLQKLLPWYITSHVRNGLFKDQMDSDFLANIKNSLINPEKMEIIKSKFAEDLSMMLLIHRDVNNAKIYLQNCIRYFLHDWQNVNPLFSTLRFNKLLRVRNITEAEEFINILNNLPECLSSVEKLMKRYKNEILPSVLLNESTVLYRSQFINLFVDKLKTHTDIDSRNTVNILKEKSKSLLINFVNVMATEFNNFYVARKYFPRNKFDPQDSKLQIVYGNIAMSKIKSSRLNKEDELDTYFSVADIYLPILENTLSQSIKVKINSKLFDIHSNINTILEDNSNLFEKYQPRLKNLFGTSINDTDSLRHQMIDKLKSSIENIDEDMETDCADNVVAQKNISQAYVKLAYFIRNHQLDSHQEYFIIFVLRAMKLNSSEAIKLFPCLLMINNLESTYKTTFLKETKEIPTWMFIGWIPQLLAVVDSPKITVVSKIIIRISETYPQSIMYAYRLSKENYNLNNNNKLYEEIKPFMKRMDDLFLNDENVNTFLRALSFVSVPVASLKYYVRKLYRGEDVFLKVDELFNGNNRSSDVTSMKGNMYKSIEIYKKKIANLKGKSKEELQKILQPIDEDLKEKLGVQKLSQLLKDYCPWLAHFTANRYNVELEIPGQYDGQKLPLPQHHVKIFSFFPDVKIMCSMRKPIKIKMLGMNAREYPFLIKAGEDIRQDQRIEQLFVLMNDIYGSDKCCSNRNFDILTYQVIPLTSSLGIIQWVDDTVSLKELILQSLSVEEKKKYQKTRNDYDKLRSQHGNSSLYLDKFDRNKAIPKLSEFINRFSRDVLKKSFWHLSINVENYIALRNNFIKTYSVLCASQWILGIGDRHLDNFLICLRNGKVLGIDFGHAFGSATQILCIPELVPFRLTTSIISFMEPLKEKGQFKENMIHCLRALRGNHNSLIATMSVFIQEPTLDWLEHAQTESTEAGQRATWCPKDKLEQAKRKILGASSTRIMIEEIDSCSKSEREKVKLKEIVRGYQEYDIRAKFDTQDYLTVEDQVECLIDHATDYNLLARIFGGWSPWI